MSLLVKKQFEITSGDEEYRNREQIKVSNSTGNIMIFSWIFSDSFSQESPILLSSVFPSSSNSRYSVLVPTSTRATNRHFSMCNHDGVFSKTSRTSEPSLEVAQDS